jgi:hypothetical protein
MTADESACDALVHGPLPDGFTRRVLRITPGLALEVEWFRLPDTVVVVEQGRLEIECRAGTCRSFGRGSVIPIARLPVAGLRSVGASPLILVALSRAPAEADRGVIARRRIVRRRLKRIGRER